MTDQSNVATRSPASPETDQPNIASRFPAMPKSQLARLTNGKRSKTVDGRSAEARRLRDLEYLFAEPLGGLARLPEAARQLVRRTAALAVASEQMSERVARGEPVDALELARVASTLNRLTLRLERFQRQQAGKSQAPSLAEYVARHAAQKAPA